jgi:hypothetical protein
MAPFGAELPMPRRLEATSVAPFLPFPFGKFVK